MADLREQMTWLNAIARGYTQSQMLFVANEAEVFALLDDGPRSAASVAGALDWAPRGATKLLDALVGLELVEKSGEGYVNTALASACLVPGKPDYQGNIIRHQHFGWANWSRLDEAVRTGTGVKREEERSGEELRAFILGMSNIAKLSAQEVLEATDLSAYRHVLDLGGGPATYSIAFLERFPEMRATLFDLAPVIPIGQEQVARAKLEERFAFIPGDMTVEPFGTGYDLVFISNIIHSFGPETNRAIVQKAYDALAPGGRLILKDFLVENDRSGPAFSLFFALHMLVHTGEGDTYTFAEVADWTDQAGFKGGTIVRLTPQTRLWIADKG